MNSFRQTVSAESMQDEWAEIQAAQQNPALFRPLYDRYFQQIFQFVFKRTQDEGLCADLTSQVFLKAMHKLGAYKFQGVPFSAWLFRIASNEVAQHYRQSAKNRVVSIEERNLGSLFEEMEEDKLAEHRTVLIPSLDELRPKDLELLEMRFFEQRPFKEIAEILEITESNAKVRTYRVLDRLKKIMLKNMHGG